MRGWAAVASSVFVLASCDDGQSPITGLGEPIVVQGGQFISGDLPGSPPTSGGNTRTTADGGLEPLSVLSALTVSQIVVPGMLGKSIHGDVSGDTQAVGIRFPDMGSGYWVVPAGAPDTQTPGALGYSFSAGFNADDPPGNHTLRLVAIGPTGNAGTQFGIPVCLESSIPDNGHACNPSIAPPAAVFTLTWDTNFDLDMHVVGPAGAVYDTKMRVPEPLEAGVTKIPPDEPFIDRDSMQNCVPDGLRQEDLVFPDTPPEGNYFLFVDPFSACGQNAVHFTFTVYQSVGKCPSCNLQVTAKQSGELLASQATGGTSPPTFVLKLPVQ
ncbi:MAG TPA: hypothetical protein VK762_27180 [Polyangiaceae bacterium]|jgi:hypothetical protein|nr:hypothetical protein [Polyangiaceae bacterium]